MEFELIEMCLGNMAVASEETEFSVQANGFIRSTVKVCFQLMTRHLFYCCWESYTATSTPPTCITRPTTYEVSDESSFWGHCCAILLVSNIPGYWWWRGCNWSLYAVYPWLLLGWRNTRNQKRLKLLRNEDWKRIYTGKWTLPCKQDKNMLSWKLRMKMKSKRV